MSENATILSNNPTEPKHLATSPQTTNQLAPLASTMPEDSKNNTDTFNANFDHSKVDTVDVVIVFLPKYEKELVNSVKVTFRENGDIDLCDLLKSLRSLGFPTDKNMISYYSYTCDMYVYCGNDPLPYGMLIPAREVAKVNEKHQVTLRIRQVVNSFQMMGDNGMLESDNIKIENNDGQSGQAKQKRTKERKIGQILDKVYTWRKFYSGFTDPQTTQTIKMSLEDAAQKVGISKKSLDDYLLQIRFGKKYGFNFNDHYNDRVGVLRAFVKKNKQTTDKHMDIEGSQMQKFPSQEFANLIEKKDGRSKRNNLKIEASIPPTLNGKSKKITK